jgi:hypothetical protein
MEPHSEPMHTPNYSGMVLTIFQGLAGIAGVSIVVDLTFKILIGSATLFLLCLQISKALKK